MSPARRLPRDNRSDGPAGQRPTTSGGPEGGVRTASVESRQGQNQSGGGLGLSDWKVGTKINVILLVPLIAVLVLSGLRLSSAYSDMRQAGRAEQVANLSLAATELADKLEAERDLTGARLGASNDLGKDDLVKARDQVDTAAQDMTDAIEGNGGGTGPVVGDTLDTISTHIRQLPDLRDAVDRRLAPWSSLFDSYSTTISDVLKLTEQIAQGSNDPELLDDVRALSALSQQKALLSAERGYLVNLFASRHYDSNQYREYLSMEARLAAASDQFSAAVNADQRERYDSLVTGDLTRAVTDLKSEGMTDPSGGPVSVNPTEWYGAVREVVLPMRQVERELGAQALDRAEALHGVATRQAIIDGGVAVLILLLTLVLAWVVSRSLVRPLRQLRTAAADIADRQLPEAVARLRGTGATLPSAEIEPLRVRSRDEIGELATAFDSVHREAVRIAVDQARLRRNVATMFVNLSRRTQSLIERQLRLIDDLEVNEGNTDALGNLFQLDHLATRMRRNAENLLVLGGEESGRRWNRPVALVDVLRAAAAEVEQYPRLAQTFVTNREIDGRAVGDVVHLIAELLENALEFSSPETQVVVSARSFTGDAGVLIEIEDRGIGMSEEELANVNERLATPSEIDVSLSRMMGLYVVGQLAGRHDIRVQLRHTDAGGITAMLHLPAHIVIEPADADQPEALTLQAPPVAEPAAVGASTSGEYPRVDLGDHETRPIFGNAHDRPRLWTERGQDEMSSPRLTPPPVNGDAGFGASPGYDGYQSGEPAGTGMDGYRAPDQSAGDEFDQYRAAGYGTGEPAGTGMDEYRAPDQSAGDEFDQYRAAGYGTGEPAGTGMDEYQRDQFDTTGFGTGEAPAPGMDQYQPGYGGDLPDPFGVDQPTIAANGYAPPSDVVPPSADSDETTVLPAPDQGFATGGIAAALSDSDTSGGVLPNPFATPSDGSGSYATPAETTGGYRPPAGFDDQASGGYAAPDTAQSAETTGGYQAPDGPGERSGGYRPPSGLNQPVPEEATGAYLPPPPAERSGSYPGLDMFEQPAERSGAYRMPDPGGGEPPAETAPAEQRGEEFLPIFAEIESEWFRRRPVAERPAPAGDQENAEPPAPPAAPSWESAADEGWRAAEQLASPRVSGTTRSGLPIRVPQAHYVPGSAGGGLRPPDPELRKQATAGAAAQSDRTGRSDDSAGPAPNARTPEAVRGLLSNYHRGIRQGREAGREPTTDGDE